MDTKLSIVLKRFKKKRSLDANAYAWELMQQIAEACPPMTKDDVYLQCLRRYSRKFTHVILHEKAVDEFKSNFRTFVDLGEITVNGEKGHQLQCYYGSSSFDSKEMAVFIDGIVNECKEMGIETLPPYEIERMQKQWNSGK